MAEYKSESEIDFSDKNVLLGKRIIVEISWNNTEGATVDQKDYWGVISEVSDDEVVIKDPDSDKEVISLPAQFGSYKVADEAEYPLKPDGQVVSADFITAWTLRADQR